MLVVISVIVFFAHDFEKFIKTFETNASMIPLLFPNCVQLLQSVFGKFLRAEVFKKNKKDDQSYVLNLVNDLKEINVKNQTRHNASCRFRS